MGSRSSWPAWWPGGGRRRGAESCLASAEVSRTVQWRQKPIMSRGQKMAATTTLMAFSLRNPIQAWTLYPLQDCSDVLGA